MTFPNAQGLPLRGVLCWQAGYQNRSGPVIVFCPGTSGNLSSHLYYVELLCRAGFAVFGFDYTGFGQSAGHASLQSLVSDVRCACRFLQQRQGVARLGVFGLSIGANVALQAAALRPNPIGAVAVEGVAIQQEVVRGILATGVMGPRHIQAITYQGKPQPPRQAHVLNPFRLRGGLADGLARLGVTIFPAHMQDPRIPARALADVPVFFIHGVEDPLLPFEATLQAYAAKPGAKRLWLIPNVGHAQEPALAQDAEYSAQLGDFFQAALGDEAPYGSPTRVLAGELVPLAVPPARSDAVGLTVFQGVPDVCLPVGVGRDSRSGVLRLHNSGPPALVLVTIVDAQTVDFVTLWVADRAEVPYPVRGTPSQITCLRLFAVDGQGDAAQIRHTPRGYRYQEVFRRHIRELSKLLHEGRLKELAEPLRSLPRERPDAPFDFFLGLYCLQIMRRSKRKWPSIARSAAEIFTRYWPYGRHDRQDHPSDPWDLVASLMGGQDGAGATTPTRQRR